MSKNGGVRRRPSYADVMSTIAVFGVLAGGGAYAAGTIGGDDIQSNAIRSNHIKNGQVKDADLANPIISGSEAKPKLEPKTVVQIPKVGRIVSTCSFMGSGNTQAILQNRSGKKLIVSVVRGRFANPAEFEPGFERKAVPNGEDLTIVGTGGSTQGWSAWLSIVPVANAAGPLVNGTLTVAHGCGKVTALLTTD